MDSYVCVCVCVGVCVGGEEWGMSSSTTQDFLLKLLLIGDSGVGKTSLLTRFAVLCPLSPLL